MNPRLRLSSLTHDPTTHRPTNPILQISFYWILETSRRRLVHFTLLFCTAGLAIGSEILQALVPNGRDFDPFDILANVVGSALGLSICSWYHKRMLERKRKNKTYDLVPGEDDADVDLELGEGVVSGGAEGQETGVVEADAGAGAADTGKRSVTEELDQWDENADDEWEEADGDEGGAEGAAGGEAEAKKRAD